MRAVPEIKDPAAAFAFLALLETTKSLDGILFHAMKQRNLMSFFMERTRFGDIQARLFPKMGMVTTGTSLITLATYAQVDSCLC